MPEPLPTPPTWAPGCVRTRPGPVPQPSSATSPDLDQATLRRGAGHPASTRPARPAAQDGTREVQQAAQQPTDDDAPLSTSNPTAHNEYDEVTSAGVVFDPVSA